jgi:MoaA/NifB/PqqE/SkfB family radical SAM enzyme
MPSPNFTPPVVQLHPTRRCNLRCLHCYSNSAPTERYEQDASQLVHAIADAAAEGYRVVSISGGEPLLYSGLPSLLDEARRHGLHTTVTTNGLLLDDRRTQLLSGRADFLAISLDGAPERHNYMRNAPHAFEIMQGRLGSIRSGGLPFGFLFTLTHENIGDLDWVAEFAAAEGANLLQIHPLEETGRAQSHLAGSAPTDIDATLAWLLAQRLMQRFAGRLKIHLDLLDRDALRDSLQSCGKLTPDRRTAELRLADFISPLVIESEGTIVPLQYGFPRAYALGNLNDLSLENMARSWLSRPQSPLEALYERVLDMLCQPAELPFVNWYESMIQVARGPHQALLQVLE